MADAVKKAPAKILGFEPCGQASPWKSEMGGI